MGITCADRTALARVKPLRHYQEEAVYFLEDHMRCLFYDDMGLGKTRSEITFLEEKIQLSEGATCLILCPTYALYVWQDELMKWLGVSSIVYWGSPAKREKLWWEFLGAYSGVIITTYEMLAEIMRKTTESSKASKFTVSKIYCGTNWNALVCDEIDRVGLLNHKTQIHARILEFTKYMPVVQLLTGTPLHRGCIDLFAPLNIIAPGKFSNYWSFVNKWCITLEGQFGKSIERRPKDPDAFRAMLRNYMIRRLKSEVLHELPGKDRYPVSVDMSDRQQKAFAELSTMILETDDNKVIITPNKLTNILRMRQLLVCPKILGIDDYGGALTQLVAMSEAFLDEDKPIAVYTPFAEALPYIKELFEKRYRGIHAFTLQGGMRPDIVKKTCEEFENPKYKKKVIIIVISSAASYTLNTVADTFFLGYEWDFTKNTQAEDRHERLGQDKFVLNRYLMYKGTVDEDIAARLNEKNDAAIWSIGTEEEYRMILKRFGVKSAS